MATPIAWLPAGSCYTEFVAKTVEREGTAEEILNQFMGAAEKEHASDIHIEPRPGEVLVRMRVDGILKEVTRFDFSFLEALVSRLKIMAQLDITSHATPQEGHFEWLSQISGNDAAKQQLLDVRLSSFPTIYGETVVLRILNRIELLIPLPKLGFSPQDRTLVETLIRAPYGLILSAGPAGSGKTTFMYSVLTLLATPEKNIVTLEDPIEYHLKNVRQSQIQPERGFTFESGMRSILRQDPDVIMIGEIRDPVTVETAINASLTGRLLFSTLHANSSVGTLARLLDMKIDPALIAYALNGVIAQRLVRKICQSCRTDYSPDPKVLELLGLDVKSGSCIKGNGCDACRGTGYQGRTGIFEVLVIDNEFRKAIVEKRPIEELEALAKSKGLKSLHEDAIDKLKNGVTTVEELFRLSV